MTSMYLQTAGMASTAATTCTLNVLCIWSSRQLSFCRFPFAEPLTLHSGETVSSAQVIEAMAQFMGPERLARMEQVFLCPCTKTVSRELAQLAGAKLIHKKHVAAAESFVSCTPHPLINACAELSLQVAANRTFNVLPIVEGVYDMGNLAAIARSADGAAPAVEELQRLHVAWCDTQGLAALQRCIVQPARHSKLLNDGRLALQRWAWGPSTSSTPGEAQAH